MRSRYEGSDLLSVTGMDIDRATSPCSLINTCGRVFLDELWDEYSPLKVIAARAKVSMEAYGRHVQYVVKAIANVCMILAA